MVSIQVEQAPVLTMKTTLVFKSNMAAWLGGKRRALNEGGTSSSKTWSILQLIIAIARGAKSPLTISVVSESLPHLKRGAMRDFFLILNESQDDNPNFNKSEHQYKLDSCTIEFFGADEPAKVRGPRRDILFLNEANNIPWETAQGLDIRTSLFTFADWNPTGEFWAHEYWIPDEANNAYIHSTYKDALAVLPQQTIQDIESYRERDPNWWRIYGLGLIGKVEDLVYPIFEQVAQLPEGPKFYGLDFGFLVDPTVLVANVVIGDKLYSQEMFYEYGLDNEQIARKMDLLGLHKGNPEIFADADEPKSILEIRKMGFNIKESVKGQGSVEYSHQKVRQYYQHWTSDSVNCIKEQRNFRYIKRLINGSYQLTNDTTHRWSHGMSARRYAVAAYNTQPERWVTRRTNVF